MQEPGNGVRPVCVICGVAIPDDEEPVVLPPFSGGTQDVILCQRCNREEVGGGE